MQYILTIIIGLILPSSQHLPEKKIEQNYIKIMYSVIFKSRKLFWFLEEIKKINIL